MITKWTLKNFKSVFFETTLEFQPLTIFAGANSSGKSTLIQSILLTAQTLQSPVHSRSVILNGHIVRLGSYEDIVSNRHDSEPISIGFHLALRQAWQRETKFTSSSKYYYFSMYDRTALNSVEGRFQFSANGQENQKELLQLQPQLEETSLKVNFMRDENPNSEELVIKRSKKSLSDRMAEYKLEKSSQKVDINPLEFEVQSSPIAYPGRQNALLRLSVTSTNVGATLEHFLPSRISVLFDEVEEKSKRLAEALLQGEEYLFRVRFSDNDDQFVLNDNFKKMLMEEFRQSLNDAGLNDNARVRALNQLGTLENDFSFEGIMKFYESLSSKMRQTLAQRLQGKSDELKSVIRGNLPPIYTLAQIPPADTVGVAIEYTQHFFTRLVKYLGPLRDEPKPVYPLAGATDPKDIGFRGEHTAAVLEVYRNTQIEYIPSAQFAKDNFAPKSKVITLLRAVLDWLEYMGVANNLATSDKGKLGHELKIKTSTSEALHDLTHVGVGVSQVLPILVLSLLADEGSTLIFEQPELHLHPRVQTRLADFFVSMTTLGKQCIVETHSEYLINRLRYRAAISDGDTISKSVIMYFVEKQDEYSSYRSVKINKYGVIEDWPKGFFDENEENSAKILKAGMEKRKKETKKKNG